MHLVLLTHSPFFMHQVLPPYVKNKLSLHIYICRCMYLHMYFDKIINYLSLGMHQVRDLISEPQRFLQIYMNPPHPRITGLGFGGNKTF